MRDHQAEFRVRLMCRVFEVSSSGYYAWCEGQNDGTAEKRKEVTAHIRRVFQESRQRYGSPRIYHQLKAEGILIGRHRIANIMSQEHLVARRKHRYKKPVATTRHNRTLAPNLLNRQFNISEPNKIWTADVSYFWTQTGWVHLAIVMDLGSRRIIGWSMSKRVDKQLTKSAIQMALLHRNPAGDILHHSDQGAEYTNNEYQQILKDGKMISSMSRPRECYDNAVTESFFKTIKAELSRLQKFKTPEDARSAIFEYIEVFYNRRRLHSSLGYISPAQYEEQYTAY